jgi:hypothetical protein
MFWAPEHVFSVTEGVGSRFQILRPRTHFQRYQGPRVPFSCFVFPDSFSAVPRVSGLFFMFCAPGLVFGRPTASGPIFMFCTPGLVFGGTEGVGSLLHVLRSWTRFRWCRGRPVPFSRFALPNSFSAEPRASIPVFMFCAPVLVFGGTEFVGSRFHVLRSGTHFRRYRGSRVPFSSFAPPNSLSAVPRVSGPFFMYCASGLVFGGTEGVGSRFHALRARTRYRQYRGRQSLFHVLRSRTHFRRCRVCVVPF